MTEQNRKGYQGIRAPEALECKNRSDFKYCIAITEKHEKLLDNTGIPKPQGAISDKVTPDIDAFSDEPVVQCDVQVVENNFRWFQINDTDDKLVQLILNKFSYEIYTMNCFWN